MGELLVPDLVELLLDFRVAHFHAQGFRFAEHPLRRDREAERLLLPIHITGCLIHQQAVVLCLFVRDCPTTMADRPKELEIVDRFRASADLNHLEAFRVRRQLVELGANDDRAQGLFAESIRITLTQLPGLVSDLSTLGAQWSEVELLDPANLDSVTHAIEVRFAELAPKLEALLVRQDEVVAELVRLVREARGA